MDEREGAWWLLWDALPHDWRVGPAEVDAFADRWCVTAQSPRPRGRLAVSKYVLEGTGPTELDAVRDLTAKLRAWAPEMSAAPDERSPS